MMNKPRRQAEALPPTLTPLLDQLRALHRHLSAEKREAWNRDLPFADVLFDRWDRARTLGFGDEASIYQSSHVFGDVTVGAHTWIGPFTVLDGSGGLAIGANCSISAGVHIYSHNTVRWAVSGGKAPYEKRPVRIGDCCFIGPHSVIRDGVTLGDHVVVGAHSFVNRDVPSYSIVGGTPARLLGHVRLDDDEVTFEYY